MAELDGANPGNGERGLSVGTVLAVCIGLALVSIGAVTLGLFDQIIESRPGRAAPAPGEPAERTITTQTAVETSTTVADPEPHRAIYRDGKLYLEGAVPTDEISTAFETKAAEVIGAANVINNYVIDGRAAEPTDGRVIVDEPFLFEFDSAVIDPQFYSLLDLGVLVMELNPQATMRVVGHTDATGTPRYNKALSLARSDAVSQYLVENGIAVERVQVRGKGESQPIADNNTIEGRSLNRRIEIELLGLLS